ncbi:Hypothetical protein CM240_1137 [Clostridium bornimense]|uniref:Uncharacterized protein n=1 Tax=Clostridium bornimense TaxID=1216932 RepID=W6RUH4_9CLOT|nr:hypothetical protein [Clostridium bornimense]CDM68301.1 Hypothetical protein CM240_1137 [Clostridium bornimense]
MSVIDKSYFTQSINEGKAEIVNALNFSREVERHKEKAVKDLLNGMYFSNINSLEEGINKININLSDDLDKIQKSLESILNNELEMNSGIINKVF